MLPINRITASVRPDGLGVCSRASNVSTIQLRSSAGIRAAVGARSVKVAFRVYLGRAGATGAG
ncbi:hypothetical protein MMAD_21440 [Mycolicibacterium madagascariense]|uniref:Uncharacterized protein n=1 Tax=Mycolicibacterium madagascariense TaxID=212765 RepID=A0A7I7XF85_9MYCO|nr:hypothetical protein MMAD_21440 [Mycolicibacterium madagascariense]